MPDVREKAELLHTVAAGIAGTVGEEYLRLLVERLATALEADGAYVAEDVGAAAPAVIAAWPADAVPGPEERLRLGLHGSEGEALGHIGVLCSRPIEPTEGELDMLSIFASRASAEVERRRDRKQLRLREAEVAASRVRMLQAADDERRRIGRDLHDGAQQRIVALGHMLGLAVRKLDDAPEDAKKLLELAREELAAANAELRELARGLYPALLTGHGLRPALEALAARSPLPLHVDRLPDRRLPDPVEVTIYFLVSEAVTNAVKHAGATEVRVAVEQDDHVLRASVWDDGVGGAEPAAGSGLTGLVDRLEALGGSLVVESPPRGGTRLEVTLNLAPWRTAREPFLEFGYDGDGGLGQRLIDDVLAGRKTVGVSLAREWELEGGVPRIGQLLPVLDHAGRRHGAVEVVRVSVLPFGEIDESVVEPDRMGATTLEEWRAARRRYYDEYQVAHLLGEERWRLTDDEPMAVIHFRALEQG